MIRPIQALLIAALVLLHAAHAALAQQDAGAADPDPAGRCGSQPLTIARMQWPSAALLAEIHARLLRAEFDCEARVIPGDLASTASSMGSSEQPAIAPELWVARVPDIWNPALKDRKVRPAAPSYGSSTFEGWFMPDYVAAARPDLKSVTQVKANWQAFAVPGAPKAKFISCPPDWGCSIINRNLLAANGLSDLFDVVEPANRFELDAMIAAAVSRKEPMLFYYWQPNAVLSQFAFRPLDLGTYDKAALQCLAQRSCAAPKPSAFAPENVVIALSEWVFTDTPEIAAYFGRASMPIEEMNKLMLQLSESGATIESVADRFVAERQEVWRPWIGAAAAAPAGGAPGGRR